MKNKDYIDNFLELSIKFSQTYKEVNDKFDIYSKLLNECDKATQDLLHLLELGNLDQSGKSKIATKLSNVRKDRRYYKDKVEALQVLVDNFQGWGQSFDGCMKKLGNIAGNSRKKYQNRENRKYTPRIIKEIGVIGETK